MSEYHTIDNELNLTTTWWSHAHSDFYRNVGIEETKVGYTKVDVDVPEVLGGSVSNTLYWTQSPEFQYKPSVHKVFQVHYMPYLPSFKVYFNGQILDPSNYTILADRTLTVGDSVTEGYLWCSYLPAQQNQFSGDKRASLANVISRYVIPELDYEDIVRCRQVINNIEKHLSMCQISGERTSALRIYAPTTWIGGPENNIRSGYGNIIPGITKIYSDHITGIMAAISRIEDYIDSILPDALDENHTKLVKRTLFSTVSEDKPFMVKYMEEIRGAINSLEKYILRI